MSDLELSENELSDIEPSDDDISVTKPVFKNANKLNSREEEEEEDEEEEEAEEEDDAEEEENDDDVDGDDDISIGPDGEMLDTPQPKIIKKPTKSLTKTDKLSETKINIPTIFEKNESDYESDSDEDEDEDYLQKFDKDIRENYISDFHPESQVNNYDEIYNLAKVQRNKDNIIVDNLHKTIPILTKYEKTKILGVRAKQLNNGAKPMITLKNPVIDGYLIALKELEEKKIPVIIRRPLPNNTSEYWHLKDLEII